ncbi:MAG TPA: recombination-associated protein RdgC [Rhodocyclaceae bacterium]|nr:recombination-associated protein RdgC [Rhodocyclaceae bacterium]
MWFRNLQVFRLASSWSATPEVLAESLAKTGFRGCSALERQAQGWVPPRGNPDELVFVQGRQMLLALGVEQKLLPVSVIRQYAQERARELEESQGFKPGRAQQREIFEGVEAELLPRAFVKRRLTYVWIDPVGGWLVVDAASSGKADEVIEQLKLTLGELPLTLLKTLQAPGTAMTTWLSLGEVPGPFTIDQDCELRAPGEAGGSVRYTRHPLDTTELNQHIGRGKVAGKLAMTWNDRVSFVLTEQLQIKRLAFLDVIKEKAEQAGEGDDAFAADFTIMAGELAGLLRSLTEALGGEAE